MKKSSCAVFALVFVLVSILPLSAQVQGQWATVGTMQSTREFNAQVSLPGGKALAAGGVDNGNNPLASAEVYSPAPGTWTLTGRMAEARELFPAVVLTNGKVLVSGGLGASSTVLASAELYDPKTGTWSPAGSLSVARYAHTATLLANGKVLIAGGCTTSNCTDTVTSELYDPASNSWSKTGSLNTARYYHTAVRLKTGKVMVVGGTGTTSCELYDPSKGTWSYAASFSTIRNYHATALLPDGKVLVTGGTPLRFPISSAEIYDPAANTWTLTGSMKTPGRYGHTATLLGDGTVLVAGGEGQSISCGKACTSFIPTARTEIFNEATGKFAATTSLPRAVAYHSTTLLGSGRALTSGGTGYTATCCVIVNNAEFYTPLTLTFSASGLNFGLLQIGLTSPSQTVTVTNVSSHSATFTGLSASGDYSESNTCLSPSATLNPGQNCSITISFTPNAVGTRNGAVTLKDNSPGSPTQTIALAGTGETLALGFTPGSLNLGNVPATTSSTQSVTLTNDGSAPVKITGILITPADGTFTQTNNCPATLNVQQTCTLQITFTPPDVFTYNASLSIANSAGGPAKLSLSGTGLDGP